MGEAIKDVPDIDEAAVVGRGGFAVVYRAVDLQAGRPVAVKLLSLDLDEGDLRHFERERDAMARLSTHPNVVTLHRTGITASGTPYLVMEFASGGSLWDRLRADGPMPWAEAVAWLVPVCEAVEHAHQQGIRHRDIKPQNILISAHNRPLLSDFGIAGLAVGSETITRKANLSLAYASPEQIEGRELGDSTDVYSLGATLHTLISGSPPFSGGGPGLLNAAKRILEEPPPDLDPSVPAHVRNAVAAAMAKNPADRPTIDRFRNALHGGSVDPPQYPSGSVDPPQYPSGSVDPSRYPSGSVDPSRYPSGSVDRSQYPSGSVDPSRYPGGPVDPQYPGPVVDPPRHPNGPTPAPVYPAASPGADLTTEYGAGSTAHMPPEARPTAVPRETGDFAQPMEVAVGMEAGADVDGETGFGTRRWIALAVVGFLIVAGLAIGGLVGRNGNGGSDGSNTETAGPNIDEPTEADGPDGDGDGIVDEADNCPDSGNQDQQDGDGDGQGDACDPDDDNDQVPDEADNCPAQANTDQEDVDADQLGDACDDFPDRDRDGIIDSDDSCVTDPNPPDFDADGVPDECDSTPRGMVVTTASAEIIQVTVLDGNPDEPANLFGVLVINDETFRLPEISDSNQVRPGNWVTEPVAVEPDSPLVRVQIGMLDEVGFCLFCDDRRVDLSPDPDSVRLSLVIDTRTGVVDLATESWNRLDTVGTLSGPTDGNLSGTIRVQGDDDGDLMGSIELNLTLGREPVQ